MIFTDGFYLVVELRLSCRTKEDSFACFEKCALSEAGDKNRGMHPESTLEFLASCPLETQPEISRL